MVRQRANRKVFDWASALIACCTLIMLTSTVTHAASVARHPGTHLVYMPCEIPADHEDAVWLSIREQYKAVDFSVLNSERARWLVRQEPDLAAEVDYRAARQGRGDDEEYERYEVYMLYQAFEDHQEREELEVFGKHDDRLGQMAGKAIRRTHHTPDLPGNEVPATQHNDAQPSDSPEYVRFQVPVFEPITWRGKAPTPPPRYI